MTCANLVKLHAKRTRKGKGIDKIARRVGCGHVGAIWLPDGAFLRPNRGDLQVRLSKLHLARRPRSIIPYAKEHRNDD